MSKKSELKKEIAYQEQEIEAIEKKLFRSQTKLVLAFLEGKKPDKKEADYFRMYAALIEDSRAKLVSMLKELESLDKA